MSYNFSSNIEINDLIYKRVQEITHNKYTDDTWDYMYLNLLDREDEAVNFVNNYFKSHSINIIGGEKNKNDFIIYVAKQIDKLIPLFCFLYSNKKLSERYNSLLVRRIFYTDGKGSFPKTENLEYRYEQDFSKEINYIKKTAVTEKQIEFLEKLADEQGFLIINKKYMSKANAKKIIEYFKGTIDEEPLIFSFFVLTV